MPYDGRVGGARRLGRYELGERVGSGGLADVYVAHVEGAQGFRKRLVIKQLRSELHAHPEAFALLLAEAQLVQRLSHGNIVQVFDFGVDAQVPYMVMEHVDGVSLADLLRDARERDAAIDAAAVLFVVESVCAALDYAHNAVDEAEQPLGLVHRDVTPANILVSREGLVKLTDFGIARLSAVAVAEGRAIGTPGYRAPEQEAGAEVDRRADVYALGVVVAELAECVAEQPLRAGLVALADRATRTAVAERIADAGALGRALEQLRASSAVPRGAGELAARVRRLQGERRRVAQSVDAALRMRGRAAQTEALVGSPARGRAGRWSLGLGLAGVVIAGTIAALMMLPDASGEAGGAVASGMRSSGFAATEALAAEVTGQGSAGSSVGPAGTSSGPVTGVAIEGVGLVAGVAIDGGETEVGPVAGVAINGAETGMVSPVGARSQRVRPAPLGGRLRVNLIPWAEVTLDGAAIGRTPIDRRVATGRHTLELRNPESGQRRSREIAVGRGGELNITEW